MSELRVQIIRDAAGLAALAGPWSDLWRGSPAATVFQSPAWLMAWWDVFAPGQLATIALWSGDRLVALAPLYLETGSLGLRLLPMGIGISDYTDVLLDPADPEEAARLLAETLPVIAPWEICEFPELAPDAAALALPCPPGTRETRTQASLCPVLPLLGEPAELRAYVPAARLRKLGTAQRRAARRGDVAIVVGDSGNGEAMLQDLVRLHRACWNRRGQPGVLDDSRVPQFHFAALPGLMRENLLRLYALTIGDRVASVYYGFVHHRRAFAYLGGYDPEFAFESPGALLMEHALEDAIAEGDTEFDFLRGGEAYKHAWGAKDRANIRRVFFRGELHAR
jgi:CelD/BcsL family acetyltransferase involved in cellulose biosynthesis